MTEEKVEHLNEWLEKAERQCVQRANQLASRDPEYQYWRGQMEAFKMVLDAATPIREPGDE